MKPNTPTKSKNWSFITASILPEDRTIERQNQQVKSRNLEASSIRRAGTYSPRLHRIRPTNAAHGQGVADRWRKFFLHLRQARLATLTSKKMVQRILQHLQRSFTLGEVVDDPKNLGASFPSTVSTSPAGVNCRCGKFRTCITKHLIHRQLQPQ